MCCSGTTPLLVVVAPYLKTSHFQDGEMKCETTIESFGNYAYVHNVGLLAARDSGSSGNLSCTPTNMAPTKYLGTQLARVLQ
jgi:hypothetical protein